MLPFALGRESFQIRALAGKSRHFQNFYRTFFVEVEDRVDAADCKALASLQGAEKAEAEKMLIDAIRNAGAGDNLSIGRFVRGLRVLRTQTAADFLKGLLLHVSGYVRIDAAKALWEMEAFPEAEAILLGSLRGQNVETLSGLEDALVDECYRIYAACALGHVLTPASQLALLKALDDDCPAVRINAAVSLLAQYDADSGRPVTARVYSKFVGRTRKERRIQEGLKSSAVAERTRARQELIELLRPTVIPEQRVPEFEIRFCSEDPDYVIYREGGRDYWFHLWRWDRDTSLFTRDCLSGPMGQAIELKGPERFRIIPRVVTFLREHGIYINANAGIEDEPHPAESRTRAPRERKS